MSHLHAVRLPAFARAWTQATLHAYGYVAGVAALTLIGAGLRFADLSAKSVWLDEAFSVWMAHHAPADLWQWLIRIDHHPPLYYLLLHGWQGWFGDGPGAIRGLSALCSTLAIPLLAGTARALGGRQAALVAALILAVSPWQVRFAQEARMYGLLMLTVAGVLYAVARLLTQESTGRGSAGLWLLLVISQAAAMLTHNTTTVLLPAALNLGVGGAWLVARTRPHQADLPGLTLRGFARCWLGAQGAVLVVWALWAQGFWQQVQVVDRRFWLQLPTWAEIGAYGRMLAAGFLPAEAGWPALAVMLGLAVLGVVAWHRQPGRVWLMLALLLTPPLAELLISLRRPIFHLPSLIWTSLPFYLLAAVGWTALTRQRRRIAVACAVALILLWGWGLRGYFVDFEKERWDLAAAHVASTAQPGDLVIFNASWVQLPFEYYARRQDLSLELRGAPVDLFDRAELEPAMTKRDLDALAPRIKGRDVVWLVYSHNWYTDPQGLIPIELERHFAQVETFSLPEIEIHRYSVPRAASR